MNTSKSAFFLAYPTHKLLINNQWVEGVSKQVFTTSDPSNGRVLANITSGQKEDVDKAVAAARKALASEEWLSTTPLKRGELLWRLADLIQANVGELAELETLDQGKPLSVSAFAEIPAVIKQLRFFSGAASKIEGNTTPTSIAHQGAGRSVFAFTKKEPVGVVAAIVPWNSPLLMIAMKIAPALAAGCTLVLKPAEDTSLSTLRLGELIIEAGFPAGVVNIVTGYGSIVGEALAKHNDVDKVAFTGSTATGRAIIDGAKSNLKKVSLELGGKSPVIILEDADLARAIPAAANAIFFNSGQVCAAGSRLYAHHSVFDQVVKGICEIGKQLKIGPGLDKGVEVGPLVNARQLKSVTGFVERALASGAKIELGGKALDREGYFMPPTVLSNVHQQMEIVQEEVFGPVLVCQRFEDVNEVIELANNSKYGLAASVWTENFSMAHRISDQIRAGTVWINCHYMFDPSLPIGGMKQSGWGRDNGMQALDNYLEIKTVCAVV
jgi:phenylacetaldehyde dehydrogenase